MENQRQVTIPIYHPKSSAQKILLWGFCCGCFGVFSNHKGLPLTDLLTPLVLQLENVMAGLFCQKLSQDPESGRLLRGDCWQVHGIISSLCMAMWWFHFEDGRAAVAKKIIIRIILIGSVQFVESLLLHVFMMRKKELLGTYQISRVGFAAFCVLNTWKNLLTWAVFILWAARPISWIHHSLRDPERDI